MGKGKIKGGGSNNMKRQGKIGQRDKWPAGSTKEFKQWVHKKKQKSGRDYDYTSKELKDLQQEYNREVLGMKPKEIPPQPDRFADFDGYDSGGSGSSSFYGGQHNYGAS